MEIGAVFRCQAEPERLAPYARQAERLGLNELWIVEDCFFGGGVSTATVALAATDRLAVGIGLLPAVMRNPAVTAMELASLARYFPGRVLPGLGHGVAAWMRQIGAFPASQMAALEETTSAVRRLLAAEAVTMHGRHVNLDEVRLEHPPAVVPPVYLGVTNKNSLALSGRVADRTLLCEPSTPEYIRWARSHVDEGRQAGGRSDPHHMTVYVLFAVDQAGEIALREEMADVFLRRPATSPQFTVPGLAEEITALVARHPEPAKLAAAIPAEWLRRFAAVGTPEQIAESLNRAHQAGADSVIVMPPTDGALAADQLELFGRDVLPLLRG